MTLAQDLKAVLEIADTLRARQSSRDDRLAEKLDELVARIESQVARLEEALTVVGDYAFGVWDSDEERLAAGRRGEGLARAALASLAELGER